MGIVNINDDSFCGDGKLDADKPLAQAAQMLRDRADIIDIGRECADESRADHGGGRGGSAATLHREMARPPHTPTPRHIQGQL